MVELNLVYVSEQHFGNLKEGHSKQPVIFNDLEHPSLSVNQRGKNDKRAVVPTGKWVPRDGSNLKTTMDKWSCAVFIDQSLSWLEETSLIQTSLR